MHTFNATVRLKAAIDVRVQYRLPNGTESLLYRFRHDDGAEVILGAYCETSDEGAIYPGKENGSCPAVLGSRGCELLGG